MRRKQTLKFTEVVGFLLFSSFILVVSISTYYLISGVVNRIQKNDFERNSQRYSNTLKDELNVYEDLMLSIKGFFESSTEGVSRKEFNHFLDTINIKEEYPGISFVYYLYPVKKENVNAYIESIRSDTSVNSTGYIYVLDIEAEDLKDINYIITYVEPQTEANVLHIGLLENTDVDSTAFQALTSNDFALSKRFGFEENDYIYQIYLPVELPNSNIESLIGLSFTTKGVFKDKLVNLPENFILEVKEFDTGNSIYKTEGDKSKIKFTNSFQIEFANKYWTIQTTANSNYRNSDAQAYVPFLVSSLVCLMLFIITMLVYRLYLSRKNVSKLLEDTESKFKVIFDESIYLLGLLDTEGTFVEVNKTALQFGQIKKESVVGKKFWETFWWQNDPKNQVILQKVISDVLKGKAVLFETKILGYKQGIKQEIPIELSIKPIKDSFGKVIFLLLAGKDITKLKNYEADLDRFKQAVDNASDHIIFTDPDGTVLYANDACSNITGYTPDEIIGANPKMWGGLMSRKFYQQMWAVIKNKKRIYKGKLKNKRKNGDIYDASVIISPILDDDKEIKFFVGMERDITEEQEVDRLKTEFISVASHQLRTPLTGIRWLLELIDTNTKLTKEQKQIIDEITINTDRMVTLVNDLLDVSHIETGRKFAIEPSKIKLKFLIKEAVEVNKMKAEKKKIKILIDMKEDADLFIDANKFKEVLANLVDNAIKYSKVGTNVYITSNVYKNKFEIDVRDEGCGIPRTQQNQVFNKFFRADNAVKMQASGSGLGLYIAKSIVEAHDGTIKFISEQNKGTTFTISMPLKIAKSSRNAKKENLF